MKTSYRWLQQYVDIPWDPAALADKLTLAGLEVESLDRVGELPPGVVVAQILSQAPHPASDHLFVCQVDDGSGPAFPVVCGAPNCAAGRKAALARIGTPVAGFGTVKKAKLRGVESFGMLCSERELGLSDDHRGIMLLADDAPVGKPLSDYLGTDTVIDWEITPNRPDWLCHLGIAREIAALTRGRLRPPTVTLNPQGAPAAASFRVAVSAPDLCPRYTARLLRHVTIGPSPQWLQNCLRAVGLRPINNVVDITNFVMMECGQPLHAFDAELLAGRCIIVRRAAPGELLTTLDGREHQLTTDHLLIADAERGVALAGVMGGGNSEIREATTEVLLESAVFSPPNIRATAKQLAMSTDAAYRFQRGVDIEMCEFASARAASLICELAGAELAPGLLDVRATPWQAPQVACRYERLSSLLGVPLTAAEVKDILTALGLTVVAEDTAGCTLAVPPWRPDLRREADLAEEVARLYGLDRIPAAPAMAQLGGPRAADAYYGVQQLRDQLIALGLHECLTYSMISEREALAGTGFTAGELLRLKNPVSAEFEVLRPSLLPGILGSLAHNIARDSHDLRLCELGLAYCRSPRLPEERTEVCIALSGRRHPERYSAERAETYDFSDLRGVVEDLLTARHITGAVFRAATAPAFVPGVTAELVLGDRVAGVLGEVCAEWLSDRRRYPVFIALLDVTSLVQAAPPPATLHALPPFPAVSRDLALVAPETLTHRQVVDCILAMGVEGLERVELFDIYRDDQALGAGRKSLAYSLTYRSPARTLTDEEVNTAHQRVRDRLAAELAVELR